MSRIYLVIIKYRRFIYKLLLNTFSILVHSLDACKNERVLVKCYQIIQLMCCMGV